MMSTKFVGAFVNRCVN